MGATRPSRVFAELACATLFTSFMLCGCTAGNAVQPGNTVVDAEQADAHRCTTTDPKLVYKKRPLFPRRAKQAGIERATVILRSIIDTGGRVKNIEVEQSSEPGYGFEAAAVRAVTEWRYEPATVNCEPVEVYFYVQVEFINARSRTDDHQET